MTESFDRPFDLSNRTALITGAGRGIGREIARTLARAGADIVVAEFDRASGEEAAAEMRSLGRTARFVQVDVADPDSVRAMTEEVYREVEVDVLVNNAGVAHNVAAEEMSDADWRRVVAVDLDGVFWCCREIGRRMLARGRGSIVNIGSMSGHIANDPQPQAHYNSAKAGVIMLSKSLAAEWARRGVRVNSVSPGYIATDMVKGALDTNPAWRERWISMTPIGRLGTPVDVAHAVLYLASDAAAFATGTDLRVDGGYTSW